MQPFVQETIPPPLVPTEQMVNSFPSVAASLSHVDSDILLTLHTYHYLTASQITTALSCKPSSMEWIRKKVNKLLSFGLLHKQVLPERTIGGHTYIYSLATKGTRYLETQGIETTHNQTPSENDKSYLYLTHTLRLNDVLIAARELTKLVPGITIAELRHERVLQHFPTKVTYKENGNKDVTGYVVPDGWLDFHCSPPFGTMRARMPILLELDRNTVDVWPFRKKIRKYAAFIGSPGNSPYEKEYGTYFYTIAFLAAEGGEKRALQMKTWVESELRALDQGRLLETFLFGNLPTGCIDTKNLFLSPVWFVIGSDKKIPLLQTQ